MNDEVSKSEQTSKPEGDSPARAGETARQLIRRAKHASRRRFPAEEKIRIVMEGKERQMSIVESLSKTYGKL